MLTCLPRSPPSPPLRRKVSIPLREHSHSIPINLATRRRSISPPPSPLTPPASKPASPTANKTAPRHCSPPTPKKESKRRERERQQPGRFHTMPITLDEIRECDDEYNGEDSSDDHGERRFSLSEVDLMRRGSHKKIPKQPAVQRHRSVSLPSTRLDSETVLRLQQSLLPTIPEECKNVTPLSPMCHHNNTDVFDFVEHNR